MDKMCNIKYIGHEYIKMCKGIVSVEGIISLIIWVILYIVIGTNMATAIALVMTFTFIILTYKKSVKYCKNKDDHAQGDN